MKRGRESNSHSLFGQAVNVNMLTTCSLRFSGLPLQQAVAAAAAAAIAAGGARSSSLVRASNGAQLTGPSVGVAKSSSSSHRSSQQLHSGAAGAGGGGGQGKSASSSSQNHSLGKSPRGPGKGSRPGAGASSRRAGGAEEAAAEKVTSKMDVLERLRKVRGS